MSDRPDFLLFIPGQELAPTWQGEPGFTLITSTRPASDVAPL